LYRPSFINDSQIYSVLEQIHGIRLSAKFRRDRFTLSPSVGEKKTIFAIFCISAFSGVASWRQSEKAENGVQLQTFPYPMVSKSFLYSNAFMAKWGAQTLTFKSMTKKQTDRQTNKKLNVFGRPVGG